MRFWVLSSECKGIAWNFRYLDFKSDSLSQQRFLTRKVSEMQKHLIETWIIWILNDLILVHSKTFPVLSGPKRSDSLGQSLLEFKVSESHKRQLNLLIWTIISASFNQSLLKSNKAIIEGGSYLDCIAANSLVSDHNSLIASVLFEL